jgi:uncharacterized protein YndB with AHSA1/START domain
MSERSQTHATFVLERYYPVPVERVRDAFANPEMKRQSFGSGDFVERERREDFRVGGVAIHDATHGKGSPLSQFRATYTDITPYERIIYTYDMWLDGVHASTSITTIVLEPSEDGDSSGTRLTFTEQGVHLDGVHSPGPQGGHCRSARRDRCVARRRSTRWRRFEPSSLRSLHQDCTE